MASRAGAYIGSSIERQAIGTPPSGPYAGLRVTLTLRIGTKSHGYRTGYQGVPCRWYTVAIEGAPKDSRFRGAGLTWTFTGKRFAEGAEVFAAQLAAVNADCDRCGAPRFALTPDTFGPEAQLPEIRREVSA